MARPPEQDQADDDWVDDGTRRPIPQPAETFLLGNIPDIDPVKSIISLRRLAKVYGGIFQLKLRNMIVLVSTQKIVHAISDESKFEKVLSAPLFQVRNFTGDGLFTAFSGEHNWTLAHHILIPAFGPIAIKKMQGMMMEIMSQMLMYWETHAGQPFEAADQFTRLTFDTIGWCAFRYRFNSFFTEKLHPFIDIMVYLLIESGKRTRRLDIVKAFMFQAEADYQENIKELHRQCDEIVAQRRANPNPDAHDLLNNMILDKDPKTGEHLSDDNIRFQMVTFLIAGHETTSGMLSFATYYMLKNPKTFMKAREEADKAIADAGGNLVALNPTSLVYIDAICKEALRLQPTAPAWTVAAKAEGGEVLPGGYHVEKGQAVNVLLHELHRDPAVWGADAEEFRPERFLEGRTYPPDAYKPFGNGARACIGRGFAMQEAVLALALITSRFDIEMADPSYDLEIRQSLTVKPDNFRIVARPRKDRHQSLLAELLVTGQAMSAGPAGKSAPLHPTAGSAAKAGSAGKLYVLYGSNSGSCEGLANEIANEGSARGFAVTLSDLDSMAGGGALPTDGPVVICTASYEGRPTDNARMFVSALESTSNAELAKGVKYCVIGAGHHDWASTFHRVPTLVDRRLAELGGERFMPLHTSDAGGDIVGDFEAFKNDLWEYFVGAGASGATSVATTDAAAAAAAASADKPATPVRVFSRTTNATAGKIGAGIDAVGEVLAQEILVPVTDENPQINSMTVKLPEGQTYRSGDYLAVLARNPAIAVERALKHFGLNHDDRVVLDIPSSYLPSKVPVSASNLLAEYVELGQPVSKRLLPRLAELATDGSEKQAILALDEKYPSEIMAKRVSLLDLLERFPSCKVTFDFFIVNIPKMKIRQYSISSTPLASPSEVTLTFRIHTVPGQGGAISRPAGVASNYLAFLHPGDSVLCSVKASAEFHLPQDPSTPVVMFAAGSGFAPFRGFIHERALQKAAGRTVGPTVLYYGCRDAGDMVHKTELAGWVREGVLDLRPVLSRSTATSIPELQDEAKVTLSPEQRYVQHRVWVERKDVSAFFHAGATFYTCGSGAKLGSDLKKTLVEIIRDEQPDLDAQKVYERLAKDRHKTDVFL